MTYYFVGKNTALNHVYKAEGETFEEIYQSLVDRDIMHADSRDKYIADVFGVDIENYDTDTRGGWLEYEKEYYKCVQKLEDKDYIDIMKLDRGNAYYQEICDESGKRVA